MAFDRTRILRGAIAGATAAGVWALQQPLDKRALQSRYDDLELLGRFAAPGASRPAVLAGGLALHLGNGAAFGAAYSAVAPLLPIPPVTRGPAAALAEHLALWPLGAVSDRLHPARERLPQLAGNRRAFWQSAWRHLVFGLVLGELERRLNAPEPEPAPDYEGAFSSNGHGRIEHAAVPAEPGW